MDFKSKHQVPKKSIKNIRRQFKVWNKYAASVAICLNFSFPRGKKKKKTLFVQHRFFCIIIRNADGKFKLGNGLQEEKHLL